MSENKDDEQGFDPAAILWPEGAFPIKGVQTWVAAVLNLSDAYSVRPVVVYVAYTDPPDQRLTARLAVRNRSGTLREVVFKGNRFPLLAGSARAHSLVSRCCTGMVPRILAWEENDEGSSQLLYEPFVGHSVGESGNPAWLVETARTMATIQNSVTVSSDAESASLARMIAADIPAAFEAIYAQISSHVAVWCADSGGNLSKWLGFRAGDVLRVLESLHPQIVRFAQEVTALNLPISIDHGDLHGGNALVQADGTVLIYDWETATLGCPLFSVEKLLVAAWRMDTNSAGSGPWGYVPGTPTEAHIRDAYLEKLGVWNIDKRSFAAAMCLAVVKEMHSEIVWANWMGWPDGNPEWTAQLISRLRHHIPWSKA